MLIKTTAAGLDIQIHIDSIFNPSNIKIIFNFALPSASLKHQTDKNTFLKNCHARVGLEQNFVWENQ